MSPRRRFLFLSLGLAALLAGITFSVLPRIMESRLRVFMAEQGFTVQSIEGIKIRPSGTEFTNIALDKDGFSTIGAIRVPTSPASPYAIVVRDMALSGEMDAKGHITVDGWRPVAPAFPSRLRIFILDGAKLDLTTASGSIRLEARGQMVENAKGARHIDAVLSGAQNQLTFESKWTVDWKEDGAWAAYGDIDSLTLRVDALSMTRATGWLALQSAKGALAPQASGQIAAGLIESGPLSLKECGLTLNGTTARPHVLFNAKDSGGAVRLSADIGRDDRGGTIGADLDAPSAKDASAFLARLKAAPLAAYIPAALLDGPVFSAGSLERAAKRSGAGGRPLRVTVKGQLESPALAVSRR